MTAKSPIKPPVLLKNILDICFILLAFRLIASMIILIWQLSLEKPFFSIVINGNEISEFTNAALLLILLKISISVIFLYVVHLLRKLVKSFFNERLFTKKQVDNLNSIGQLILFTSIAEAVINFLFKFFLQEKIRLGLKLEEDFGSFWFTIALGLFFILLSKAFKQAQNLKEENDLTV